MFYQYPSRQLFWTYSTSVTSSYSSSYSPCFNSLLCAMSSSTLISRIVYLTLMYSSLSTYAYNIRDFLMLLCCTRTVYGEGVKSSLTTSFYFTNISYSTFFSFDHITFIYLTMAMCFWFRFPSLKHSSWCVRPSHDAT